MPSSESGFVPFAGSAGDAFRPLGAAPGDPVAGAEPAAPTPDPLASAFEAGRLAALAEGAVVQAELARDVAAAIDAVRVCREELRTRYAATVVTLAVEVARTIVGDEFDARPERWAPIVARAIRDVVEREQVTVRISARLAACLRAHEPALGSGDLAARIVEDPGLDARAGHVESATGDVDRGLDTQLAIVAEALGVAGR